MFQVTHDEMIHVAAGTVRLPSVRITNKRYTTAIIATVLLEARTTVR